MVCQGTHDIVSFQSKLRAFIVLLPSCVMHVEQFTYSAVRVCGRSALFVCTDGVCH